MNDKMVIDKEKFKASLITSWGELDDIDYVTMGEYSNGINLRDVSEDKCMITVNKIGILHVINDHAKDEYDVAVFFAEDGIYYATTPSVIESVRNYMDVAVDHDCKSMNLLFTMGKSRNRRDAYFLKVMLRGMI